mgnify:CR=1 FL=1
MTDLIDQKNEYFNIIIDDLKHTLINNFMPKDFLYVTACLSNIIDSENFNNLNIKQDIYNR